MTTYKNFPELALGAHSHSRIGTVPSDNGDANESVAEKLTSRPLKLFRPFTKSPSYLKKVGKDDTEEKGPRLSSERDSRELYHRRRRQWRKCHVHNEFTFFLTICRV